MSPITTTPNLATAYTNSWNEQTKHKNNSRKIEHQAFFNKNVYCSYYFLSYVAEAYTKQGMGLSYDYRANIMLTQTQHMRVYLCCSTKDLS